jgi:hypothetical protein
MRLALDDQGSDELDKAFAEFVAKVEKTAADSEDRIAETGAEVRPVLFSEDRENRRVALVPLDDAPAEEPPTFGDEVDAFIDDMVKGEIGNLRYVVRPGADDKWTVQDKNTGRAIGEPHDDAREAVKAAVRLNTGRPATD